ncbi:N-acetylmuramoyl-L-alanine amidase [Paracoccus alcaliphilus]|uniref:N-acetylmuramoyl-L-alanine amidase n=1 Tax=Paracoccus alcaliphilus TaxID=34002 RepID=A0A1H8GE70_9RHOB|nr:N-acetylmuramoyl-L-alanine amidase [Paracoccus alcaliphilus]WCR17954.1 N-acetylmuramoyl-L-alanine amidase [Paracoccus alcaliphilus]SEN41777.1 N-acetylmuramoyl-L-alanine amidase [Paracoccus alcaliphilus]
MRWLAAFAMLLVLLTAVPQRGMAQMGTAAGPELVIGASTLTAEGRDRGRPRPMDLRLTLSKAAAWRAFLVADPIRLIVDVKGLDFGDYSPDQMFGADLVPAMRWGRFGKDWSRIVLELPGPYRIEQAYLRSRAPEPQIHVSISPVSDEEFAPRPSATAALRNLPDPVAPAPQSESEALTVVLDPGHGGFDPGAQAEGHREADLVLAYALDLRGALQARGIEVHLTRSDDRFVSLESRMTIARDAGADLLLSLHADALPQGQAAGATVYVWNPASNDLAARLLAERHDRDDLLAGVDLTGHDDALATVLMDFARTDTHPRSENMAGFLTSHLARAGIGLHGRPVQGAAFSVLKSPDIPSVLLELGFISDPVDRANILNPEWQGRMVGALADAIAAWGQDETQRRGLLRR